jgi:muconate cycloisomerase
MMPDVRDLECCLKTLLVGRGVMDTNAIEDLVAANFPGTRFHGKACLVRAGVSIAAFDLKSRLLGISLSDMLGGRRRTRVPICYPIFRLKSRADVADRCELVARQLDAGFHAFRFYFGRDSDADEEFLETICGRYGDRIELTSLDGSGLFTLPAFLRAYRRLRRFPFASVESPVDRDDVDSIAEARRNIDHPVSEHVRSAEYAVRLIRTRAVDIFNISITVAGGISGMLRLFALADAANIECLIGTTQELSVATAAQAHVGAAAPRLDYASDPVGPCLYTRDVTRERVRYENGAIVVPEGPGLGVAVDLAKVREMAAPLSSVGDVKTAFSRG